MKIAGFCDVNLTGKPWLRAPVRPNHSERPL